MAVRLQLKLGAVTEQDRLADSPDTIVVVEPSVGSVGRTKGHLYLLVTSKVPGNRAREATRLIADTIRNEYYYDESAGIRQCLIKVLGIANKRLAHQRDRYGLGKDDGPGPIGVAVAVVRGREMYVATVGPAEAYLIRQARLSTLPDPNKERGLPAGELEPEVWRGELQVGDSLCLVSANVVARVGTDALKDALVTLHPQSAIEHLHARFAAADGKGSDGAVAFEASEVGATHKAKTLVPVRPDEPLAGAPDRGPIPLADSAVGAAAAMGAGAAKARDAAGNGFQRAVWRVQDLLPRRRTGSRKVTAATSRMETQRRAAVALLAFIGVAGALAFGVYAVAGQQSPTQPLASLTIAQAAYRAAEDAVGQVTGDGVDLIRDDQRRALELLTVAYAKLDEAEAAGYSKDDVEELRGEVMAGLDRLYGVVQVRSSTIYEFPSDTPVQLDSLVRGSLDGAPYVLDSAGKTVWRIDLAEEKVKPIAVSGDRVSGTRIADPHIIATGGPDVIMLDERNNLWRWRPVDTKGKGTLVRTRIVDSASWGNDVDVIATFVANFDAAFYKLYIVDPSEQNIMVMSPANDGSGYPVPPIDRLPTDRPVDGITDLLLDGDIFVAENGGVARVIPASGWEVDPPEDIQVRPDPRYTLLSSPDQPDGSSSKRVGLLYAFDEANDRIVAFEKGDGDYVAQYVLADGDSGWSELRDLVVLPGADAESPATAWWISGNALHSAVLQQAEGPAPTATPTPTEEPTPERTKKPRKTPRP